MSRKQFKFMLAFSEVHELLDLPFDKAFKKVKPFLDDEEFIDEFMLRYRNMK